MNKKAGNRPTDSAKARAKDQTKSAGGVRTPAAVSRRSRTATPSTPSRNPWVIVGIVGGVVLLVGLVVLIALSVATETDTADAEFGIVTVEGDDLPVFSDSGSDAAVGNLAPTVSSEDIEGETQTIAPDGRAKVIGFFAHWCPFCQEELPELSTYLNNNDVPAGVDVYAIATGTNRVRPNFPPSTWFEGVSWPAPLLYDNTNSEIGNAFGLTSYPFWVVLDDEHRVVVRLGGKLEAERYADFFRLAAPDQTDTPEEPIESGPASPADSEDDNPEG